MKKPALCGFFHVQMDQRDTRGAESTTSRAIKSDIGFGGPAAFYPLACRAFKNRGVL